MSAPYFIELIGRHGEIKARHRFEHLPIRIGRAYHNEMILDDAYIAAEHAVIEADEAGKLLIRDLDTKNGILLQGKRVKTAHLDDSPFSLGRSQLRVRSVNFSVAEEITDTPKHQWEGWPATLASIVMILLSSLWGFWLENKADFSVPSFLIAAALTMSVLFVWCGCWAFANRVFSGHARFSRHLLIVASVLLLLDVWGIIGTSLAYALSLAFLTRYGNHISMAILAGMVFCHLYTINQEHPKRLAMICLSLALLGCGIILLSNYQRSGQFADELYMPHLLPPALRLTADQPVADFMRDSASLKTPLDKAREKPANAEAIPGDE